jgi:hypothetical protein
MMGGLTKLFLAGSFLIVSAWGTPIYQNTTTDTGDTISYTANGFSQIGDELQLAGTDRLATLARVQFFNDGLAGTFDATLKFFSLGEPVGAQIGTDYIMSGISAPLDDVLNVNFTLPSLLVPNNLIFTVSVSNESEGVDIVGLDMFEPPTVGSSDNTFAIAFNGQSFVQAPTAGENVFFELDAVSPTGTPEPATFPIALFFTAAGFFFLARRARS